MDTGIMDSEKIIDSEGGVAVEEKVDTQENAAESKIVLFVPKIPPCKFSAHIRQSWLYA